MDGCTRKMELPNENIKQAVNKIIKEKGLVSYKTEVSSGCKKGNNFAGDVYKVKASEMNQFGVKTTVNLFCKTSLLDIEVRSKFSLRTIYLKELKMYDEVLKEMNKLEIENGIKSGSNFCIRCIKTSNVPEQEFLIMEDLSIRNFVMFGKDSKLDLAHTELVIKALGKFHALSFALRDQKPELLRQYSTELPETYFSENIGFRNYLNNFLRKAVENVILEGIYEDKWEHFYQNFHQIAEDCCNGQLAEPYAVICHGDIWSNNTMFKYENGTPSEVCLFDWQIARYCSPVLDIVHYIFGCTDKSFRKLNYDKLLNIYYNSLSDYLKELGSNPEELFPYSIFKEQLVRFGKFGLIKAIVTIPLYVNDGKDQTSLKEMENSTTNITGNPKTIKIVTELITHVVEDMVDLGYL